MILSGFKVKFISSKACCVAVLIDLSISLVLSTLPSPTSFLVVPCGFVPSSKFKSEWFDIGVGSKAIAFVKSCSVINGFAEVFVKSVKS